MDPTAETEHELVAREIRSYLQRFLDRKLAPDDELLVSDWAKTVYFSGTCPSKPKLLPICYSDATQHSGIGAIAAP